MNIASGDLLPLNPAPKLGQKTSPDEISVIDKQAHEMALRYLKKKGSTFRESYDITDMIH